jgi:hypothetical protein
MRSTLIAIALASASQVALAQAPDKPLGKQKFADGKVKYAAGDYRGAAELFEAAYKADPDPAYIFNVGQAYRRSAEAKSPGAPRDCQKAMLASKKFLAQMPEAPNKPEVDGYIKETTACAGSLATEMVEPVPIGKPIERPIEKPIERPLPPVEHAGTSTLQWTGLGVGGVGAVVLGIGIYYTVKGYQTGSEHDDLVNQVMDGTSTDQDRDKARIRQLEDLGPKQNTKAYAGWGIGGALVIGGALLYVLGGKPKEQKLLVAPSKDGAMVLGSFRF